MQRGQELAQQAVHIQPQPQRVCAVQSHLDRKPEQALLLPWEYEVQWGRELLPELVHIQQRRQQGYEVQHPVA